MLFNTMAFLIFFIIVLVIYWLIPHKLRYIFLLAASYFFYMQWNKLYIMLLVGVTLVTYLGGLLIEKFEGSKKKVLVLTACLTLSLGVLGVFKYFNFFMSNIDKLLSITVGHSISITSTLILPVGISFYTLQSLGYLIDVYRKDIYAEKNIVRYALFVAFFPQLVAGPIERSKNLLKQLGTRKTFSLHNLRKGFVLMLWGLFVKMVIADRAAMFVDTVYNNGAAFPGFYIVIATMLFSIQIYGDFYGYSVIARGSALTLGIELMDNFNAPYFSKNIHEFWRRWHISLSTWFRDYLYIPLGGNRKGKIRQMVNLMIVFGISGLWHGASFAFIIWGLLNGAYQVISMIIKPLVDKIKKITNWEDRTPGRILRNVITFLLVSFAWLFFRAGDTGTAKVVLENMFREANWYVFFDDNLYKAGIDRQYFLILLISIIVMFLVDYKKYKDNDVAEIFINQYMWVRVFMEIFLVFAILLFGCYGELYDAANFIYFQF